MTPPPRGWTRTTLGELGTYLNGRAFKKSEWADTGRPIIRIQNLTGSGAAFNHFQGELDDRYVAHPGDLLVSWAATLGAYIWTGPEAVVNQHIFKVRSRIDLKFHKYLLDHKLAELMTHTHGSGMVHITRSRFDAVPVDLPSRGEQQRVVEILEDHLSRLDAAENGVRAANRRIESLQERLVMDAITGATIPGPRRQHVPDAGGVNDGQLESIPEGWAWTRLGDVADVVGGITKDAKKQSNPGYVEVPYLRVANVQRGSLKLDDVASIRMAPAKAESLMLRRGDVLLNEGGDRDKLARGWVWQGEVADCVHQNHVFRARVRGDLDPYFLSWTANTIGGRWAERNGKQSVNLASISLSMIRRMPVIAPPGDLSHHIVRALREQLAATGRLAAELTVATSRSSALRRGVLSAAFSGKLTGRGTDIEVLEELSHV